MTKARYTTYIAILLLVGAFAGTTIAQASEVTGTLSSDASGDTQAAGNITGTVTSVSTGGSGGSGSSGGGGRSNRNADSTDTPSGAVLGASTDSTVPSFPNAGFAPRANEPAPTLWSRIITFFSTAVTAN